jgi:general secretion pathway protein L
VANDARAPTGDEPQAGPIFMSNETSQTLQRPTEVQLSEFVRTVRGSFRQLHHHPAISWITPQLPVKLLQADGGESLWLGDRRLEAGAGGARSSVFTAIELPADLVLSRSLVLPGLSQADLRDAIALEVRDSNPFDPADLVWGYRAQAAGPEQVQVTAVLAARRLAVQHIERVQPQSVEAAPPEVWAMVDDGPPIVLQGFGEGLRARRAARGRLLAYGLIVLGLMLATAVAVTPAVQLRLRTLQAVAAYQALQQRAGPAVAEREALLRGREDLAGLREVMGEHVDPMVALDVLTELIPDDTWLQRVQAQGTRFTLSGQTPNAAALMNTLSSHPGLRDVRAPSAATRGYGSNRESFVVEFTIAPELLQRAAGSGMPATVAVAVPAAAVAPVAAASAAALPASAAQAAASAPAAAVPATAASVAPVPVASAAAKPVGPVFSTGMPAPSARPQR